MKFWSQVTILIQEDPQAQVEMADALLWFTHLDKPRKQQIERRLRDWAIEWIFSSELLQQFLFGCKINVNLVVFAASPQVI